MFYATMRDMKTVLLDSLPVPGGQLATLYPEKFIYDMPGFPKVLAGELAGMMYEQATMHREQDVRLGARVEALDFDEAEGVYLVRNSAGETFRARTVLVTIGAGAFRPNRLKVDYPRELEGKQVHHFVTDKSMFKGRSVVVVGGGDSALDWVLELEGMAKEICLVHRRDKFRAHEESVLKMNGLPHVEQHLFFEVKELVLGDDGQLVGVVIENNKSGERRTLRADNVIVTLGFVADMGPAKEWGLELKGNAIVVNSHMETNRPGVYAAGDVTTYDSKIKLIATATSEASIAVNGAKARISPGQRMQPAHSSSMYDSK